MEKTYRPSPPVPQTMLETPLYDCLDSYIEESLPILGYKYGLPNSICESDIPHMTNVLTDEIIQSKKLEQIVKGKVRDSLSQLLREKKDLEQILSQIYHSESELLYALKAGKTPKAIIGNTLDRIVRDVYPEHYRGIIRHKLWLYIS